MRTLLTAAALAGLITLGGLLVAPAAFAGEYQGPARVCEQTWSERVDSRVRLDSALTDALDNKHDTAADDPGLLDAGTLLRANGQRRSERDCRNR